MILGYTVLFFNKFPVIMIVYQSHDYKYPCISAEKVKLSFLKLYKN